MGLCPGHAAAKARPWRGASSWESLNRRCGVREAGGFGCWAGPCRLQQLSRLLPYPEPCFPVEWTARTTQRKWGGGSLHPAVDRPVPSGVWCQDETPGKGGVRLSEWGQGGDPGQQGPPRGGRGQGSACGEGTGGDSLELYLPGSPVGCILDLFSWQRASCLGHTRSKGATLRNHAWAHPSSPGTWASCPASPRWHRRPLPPGTLSPRGPGDAYLSKHPDLGWEEVS